MTKGELIDALEFFKTLTFKKLFNGFLLRLSYWISKTIGVYKHWGQIESLSIEPTNLCNLKCPECPSGNNAMTRPRLFLAQKDFEIAIQQCSQTLTYLQLFFQGEPFLHPKLFEYIRHAISKNIYISTSTNGQFLNEENCIRIVDSGLQRIIISVDGATQDVYEKYRVGGSLDLVTKGIGQLVKTKYQLKSRTPYIVMQFVVFASNEHQLSDIKTLAKYLKADKLEIKKAQIENFEKGNPLIPTNKKYSRYHADENGLFHLNRKSKFKCKRIWTGAVISAENKILPCCFDKNADYSYDENDSKTIEKNWKGKKAVSFRNRVWTRDESINMCKNCTEGLK